MHHLNRTDYLGFDATLYNMSSRKRCSRCYATNFKNPSIISPKTAKDNSKTSSKFCFGVPKNWRDIIRVDDALGNTMWQYYVEKEVYVLMYCTSALVSNILITNHLMIINIIDYTFCMTSSMA